MVPRHGAFPPCYAAQWRAVLFSGESGMHMPYAQYLRVESAAGGIGCTYKEFVRACHSMLAPNARGFDKRELRHAWIRDGLRKLREARALIRDVNL